MIKSFTRRLRKPGKPKTAAYLCEYGKQREAGSKHCKECVDMYPLFKHMSDEHYLILTSEELRHGKRICCRCKSKTRGDKIRENLFGCGKIY